MPGAGLFLKKRSCAYSQYVRASTFGSPSTLPNVPEVPAWRTCGVSSEVGTGRAAAVRTQCPRPVRREGGPSAAWQGWPPGPGQGGGGGAMKAPSNARTESDMVRTSDAEMKWDERPYDLVDWVNYTHANSPRCFVMVFRDI